MRLAKYLGKKASCLLEAEPFNNWPVTRIEDIDADPPFVGYIFEGYGLQFNCDIADERIRSLFLEKETYVGTVLSDVPFNLRRDEVLAHFGSPSRSGGRISDSVLGDFGSWDRFQGSGYTIHVQYNVDSDSIKLITLMRHDVHP